jgi:hypothetical protein
MGAFQNVLSLTEILNACPEHPALRPAAAEMLRASPGFGRHLHQEIWASGFDHGLDHRAWLWEVVWVEPRQVFVDLTYFPPGSGLISGRVSATGMLYSDGTSYDQSRPTLRSMVNEIAAQVALACPMDTPAGRSGLIQAALGR